jgi:spermidine synthase
VLLASVVVIATTGLVYELIGGVVASYVLGDSVLQFSLVIGLYLFAMGVGSYLSKMVRARLLERFVEIELAIALVGGASAPLLLTVYSSYGAFRAALYAIVGIVGVLVGLEIPLLIRVLRFQLELKELVARVLALDYIGALLASLLFPLFLLPRLGMHKTSLVLGLCNAGVGMAATFLMPVEHGVRFRLRAQALMVMVALGVGLVVVDRLLTAAEEQYFGAPVIYAAQSPYQRIVITQSGRATRLFLNGNLQFSSDDEHRYHEALVHPAVAALGREPARVLVLGGGDGLAARELLKYRGVESITLVDLDRAVTDVFREVPLATGLNDGALADQKVTIVNDDAFVFLGHATQEFDLAVVDFPDPSNYSVGKLYTVSFYLRLKACLATDGVAVVQATSPYYARVSFWSIVNTIAEAGLAALPYHALVPSFGDWGFVMARRGALSPPAAPLLPASELRFLDAPELAGLFHFPRDIGAVPAPVNRINDQKLVAIYSEEWDAWR